MKKLLFASALCATAALFADPINSTGFEGFDTSNDFSPAAKTDAGGNPQSDAYFCFETNNVFGAQAADSSRVKAYGVEGNLPTFDYAGIRPNAFTNNQVNLNYLDLSTEGGTLWRTVNAGNGDAIPAGVDMTQDGKENIYIDTMVQFTPTEDGDTPQLATDDKMAIWLNVEGINTNLCIRAAYIGDADPEGTTFTVPVSQKEVVAGSWYRLTVQIISDVMAGTDFPLPGFKVFLDGVALATDKKCMSDSRISAVRGVDPSLADDIDAAKVFVSLAGYNSTAISGVGFRGTGKVDDLSIGTDVPNFLESTGSIDFTLTWDANVSAVSYTIDGTTTSIADLTSLTTTIPVAPNTVVTVAATPNAWYTVSGTGDVTVDATKTQAITTALAATPGDAGATGLPASITTAAAKEWADAKGLTPAQIAACTFAEKAYLLNTDLSVEPTFAISAIEEVVGGWKITVEAKSGETTVDLEQIRGTLKVKTGATLEALVSAPSAEILAANLAYDEEGKAEITITDSNAKFMKATVE